MPLPPALSAWRDTGTFVQVGDHRVYSQAVGDRSATPDRTLLLLHGFPESSFSYHRVIEPLRARFDRIVLLDFLGFGLSDKPPDHDYSLLEQADIAAAVWAHHGARGGHLLAHDMGDSVATELLARRREGRLPAGLALQSATFTDGNMVMELARLRVTQVLLRKPGIGPLLARLVSAPVFRHQVRSASGGNLSDEDIDHMWALLRHRRGNLLTWRLIRYLDERERHQDTRWLPALSQTDLPLHICWGAADRVAPPAVAEHLQRVVCPQATLTWLEGVGHFAQQEDPALWSSSVLAFYPDGERSPA